MPNNFTLASTQNTLRNVQTSHWMVSRKSSRIILGSAKRCYCPESWSKLEEADVSWTKYLCTMCEKINKVRTGGSGTLLVNTWLSFAFTYGFSSCSSGEQLAQLCVWRSEGAMLRGEYKNSGYSVPHSWVQWSPVPWHNFANRRHQAENLRIWSWRWGEVWDTL